MGIQSTIENKLVEDEHSVWRLENHGDFGYTDGARSDRYLESVFDKATDLSTTSRELENFIRDWPSEYHLSTKRAQLLSGFSFDPTLRVLEVGCGCGAITRHLGENFNEVISGEGDINRARLARRRAGGLEAVSVVCAPFQELNFTEKFDIIFCIGVFEYSGSFIEGEDPYDAALKYFSDILNPGGLVIIAIENQFGLKYFTSSREDHLGVMFEGVEGYHHWPEKVRTFGKIELENRVRKYFPHVQYYYPYPDYKLPECVVSESFLSSGSAGELISQMRSRDYAGPGRVLWDEAATTLELDRNSMLQFFANSFLLLAGREEIKGAAFDQLAVIYSSGRKAEYATQTRIWSGENDEVHVEKRKMGESDKAQDKRLKLVETDSPWFEGLSIKMQVLLRARSRLRPLGEIFEPCKAWIELLADQSVTEGNVRYLDGAHIDSIWSNAFLVDGECRIIDREWIWHDKIRMNVVVIRAIYDFLCELELGKRYAKSMSSRSGKGLIREIAVTFGVELSKQDFAEFIQIESDVQFIVAGVSTSRQAAYLRWFLFDRPTRKSMRRANSIVSEQLSRIREKLLSRI